MSETRKIAAILVSDVVGYSRLAGADEDRTLARLRALRSDLIDPTISVHHGRIVKRTGDGSVIEFRSVVDAVRCALEVQHAMVERNAGVAPDKRIEFRIGIHLGDVVEESDGDLMGDGVNIAARLEGIAGPGAICLSEDAYRQVKGRLDLAVSDLGPTELKNIAEPIRVYSLQVSFPTQVEPAEPITPAPPKKRFALPPLAALTAALLVVLAGGGWWFSNANRLAPVATNARPPLAAQRLHRRAAARQSLRGSEPGLLRRRPDRRIDHCSVTPPRQRRDRAQHRPDLQRQAGRRQGHRQRTERALCGGRLGATEWQSGEGQRPTHRRRKRRPPLGRSIRYLARRYVAAQDEIVARLARAIHLQLPQVETARLKRTPAANPNAEDLALECQAAFLKNDVVFLRTDSPCERALAADPNNVRALTWSATELLPSLGRGHDPRDDLKRADVLLSKALALDSNYAPAHLFSAFVLQAQFRLDEAIAEDRRALDLDPSLADAYWHMGFVMRRMGEFQRSLDSIDKAIWLSPNDPFRSLWYAEKAGTHLALKQYDQAIEAARRATAINPNTGTPYPYLIAALALSGEESQAHEALQRYLATFGAARTLAEWKSARAQFVAAQTDPRYVEYWDRPA